MVDSDDEHDKELGKELQPGDLITCTVKFVNSHTKLSAMFTSMKKATHTQLQQAETVSAALDFLLQYSEMCSIRPLLIKTSLHINITLKSLI